MHGHTRSLLATILGFAVGLCLGPVSMFAINARDTLRGGEDWPAWSAAYLTALLVTSVPAGINGAVGAGLAARRGKRDRFSVTLLPTLLHVVTGVATLATEPQSVIGVQWYTLAFTAVIWSAGRLGQRIGCAFVPVGRAPDPP